MDQITLHAYDLIDSLAQAYPEVTYDPAEDHNEFLMRSGERRLVLRLLRLRAREQDDRNGR